MIFNRAVRPVHIALEPAEPVTDAERAKLHDEWLVRMLNRLTPEERKAARALLQKNREPKKKKTDSDSPVPRKWTPARLARLLVFYHELRSQDFKYQEAVELLATLEDITPDKLKERLTQAKKLGPP